MGQAASTRILVVGCPGSGKSRLTRALAEEAGWPVRHLDDEYWCANWTRPDPLEWERRERDLVGANAWIIDGNYLESIPVRAARAHVVIVADAPALRCLYRVAARAVRIKLGQHEALPARVRAQAEAGARVRATKDFVDLVRKVIRFRRKYWWPVVAAATTNPAATLIIAVGPGFLPGYAAALRRRLSARGVHAEVAPVASLPSRLGAVWRGSRDARSGDLATADT